MPTAQTPRSRSNPIIIRNMPGFIAVEDAALLYGEDRLEEAADLFTERHFKLRSRDLDELRPFDDFEVDLEALEEEARSHPERLLVDHLTDDEAVLYLLDFGFDLRCARGLPLRSTKAIAAQVEAAARGLAGRLPEAEDIEVAAFEAKLATEAAAFAAQKRRR